MARVNHKKVKQLIQERRGKISDREFFTSRLLALHFEDIAAAQTKRYGSRRPVRVHLTWEPNAFHAACTNNLTIHINAGNPIITQFPTREERYQMVCGLFAHELGHCLYTDFLASQTYGQEISACRWYPEPPALPTVKDRVNERALWDYAQAEPENLPLLGRVAHEVGNVLEDTYIENRILEVFPGTLGQSLDFLREWQWKDMPTVTQLKEREAQGQPVFFSLLQLFLSYGKFGELKYGEEPFTEEHIRTVFELLPELDEDLQSRSGKERWKTVNTILIRCWEQVREYGQNHDPKGPARPIPGDTPRREDRLLRPHRPSGPADGGVHRCGGLHHPQGAKAHGRGGRGLRPAGTPGCGPGLGG